MSKAHAALFLAVFLATGCSSRVSSRSLSALQPTTYRMETASSSQLRIGDRNYVASVLGQVYGLNPVTDPVLGPYVAQNYQAFGGPCAQHLTGDCQTFIETKSALIAAPNSAREAVMTRTCDLLNSSDANIASAVANLGNSKYSTAALPDSGAVTAVFTAFFPGRTPSAQLTSALGDVVQAAASGDGGSPLEGWRFLFYTLCLAPDWQAP